MRVKSIKNKYLLSFVMILTYLLTGVTLAQWKFVGGPQGLYINDVTFTNSGRVIASTSIQGIFLSDDLGSTWSNLNIYPEMGDIHSLTHLQNGNIIAVTEHGLAKSRDDGETWTMIFHRDNMDIYGVEVAESPFDSSLYYGMDRQFWKSTDGGYNWSLIYDKGEIIDSYAIDDSGRVYLGIRYGKFLRSTNGGSSFEEYSIGISLANARIIQILPNHSGGLYVRILLYPSPLVHYEDNQLTQITTGSDWQNPPLGVTENGDLIYKSAKSIAKYNPRTRRSSTLSSPYFAKDQFSRKVITRQNIMIVNFGPEGLHRSTNGGRNWVEINNGLGFKPVLSIEISHQGKIFTGVFNSSFWGGLYKSLDDGVNWSRIKPKAIDAYFIDISKLKNGGLIANGSYGVYCADGEGEQWTSKAGISLAYSQYVSTSGVIFVGNDFKGIYLSNNHGRNWRPANNGIQHSYFFGFGESCSGRIFASAWPSGTYYSDDEGNSWTLITKDLLSYSRAYDFKFRNDTIFVGTSNGIAYSIDNGVTWTRFFNLYGLVNEIVTVPNGDIIAAVKGQGIYRSQTQGSTWEMFTDGIENRDVLELAFDNRGRLFAATDSGIFRYDDFLLRPTILSPSNGSVDQPHIVHFYWNKIQDAHYYHLQLSEDSLFNSMVVDDSTLVDTVHIVGPLEIFSTYFWKVGAKFFDGAIAYSSVNKFTTSGPTQLSLYQNYPNPFNSGTTIEFETSRTSLVSLKAYNILGQLVATIISQQFPQGRYKVVWNASGLSSGVYFYRIETDDGSFLTKKTLLLR